MACYYSLLLIYLAQGGEPMARPKKAIEDKYKKMTISFEPEQMEQLVSYCEREERTASWVIRKALAEWLAKHNSYFFDTTDTYWIVSVVNYSPL